MIKKALLLIPLFAIGCTSNSVYGELETSVYTNVDYSFDLEIHQYVVKVEYNNKTNTYDKVFFVPPSNYYQVDIYCYVWNEYFVSTNELFVYKR